MEAKNLYAGYSDLRKNRIGPGALRTILLFSMLWIGVSAQAQTSITYSMTCTMGAVAPAAACNQWATFRASLSGYVFSSFTISSSLGASYTCSDAPTTNTIAALLATGATNSTTFGGHTFQVGTLSGPTNCGAPNVEFAVDATVGGVPDPIGGCHTGGWTIRPDFSNSWWGGYGAACGGATQTMTLVFNVQPVGFVNGSQNGSGVYEINDTVCQSSTLNSINSKLTVADVTSQAETWSQSVAPGHGTLSGLPATGNTGSGTTASPTGVTYTPTAGFSGVDSFKVQVSNGTQTATANIIVTVNPAPTVSGGSNVSICTPASTTLTGSGASTYAWVPAAALSASTGTSVTATPTVTTIYTVTGTNTSGCSNKATVTVTVNPATAGTISGAAAMCNRQNTTFTSTIAGGTWSSTNTAVATINGTTGVAIGVSLGTSTINYTVANSCGTFVASYPVTVNMAPPGISVTPSYVSLCPTGPAILMSASADTIYGSVSVTNSSTNFVEPQNAADTSSVTVSGVPAGAVITSVVVTLNNIASKSTGEQRDNGFNLRAPNGSILNLDNGRGGSVGGIGYSNIMISSAGTVALPTTTLVSGIAYIASLTSGAPTSGSYTTTAYRANVTAWSSLYSVPNGQWTLITDNSFNGTEDTFYSWSMTVNYAFVPNVTWSSATGLYTNSGATTAYTAGTSAGSVYALPASTTTYTATATIGTCSASEIVPASVNSTLYVPVINGPSPAVVCPGSTISLADSATGGTWASQATGTATVGSATGIVTGVAAGTVVMTYNYTEGTCTGQYATKTITVNPLPAVAAIGGSTNVCMSSIPTTTLTDATTAGTFSWISGSPAVAAIGASSGVVTGVSLGTSVITYSFNNGVCTNNLTTANVIVAATPTAVTVSPLLASICPTGPAIQLAASGGNVPASTTVSSGTIAFSIPYSAAGLAGVTTPLTVSGIPAGASVTGIAVNFNATESFDGDLELNLEGPNGQVINLLSTGTSNSGANYVNTTISSAGATPIPNAGLGFPWTGVWAADASISPTVGSGTIPPTTATWGPLETANPNGAWTLVGRTNFSGNTATLTSWAITVSYTYQAPVTWSAATGLYTNSGASTPYTTGTQANTVYALPLATTTYTATATNGACSSSQVVQAKVGSPLYVPVAQGANTVCANGSVTMSDSTTGGAWSSSNTAIATVNPSTGLVSGVGSTGGNVNIIYTLSSGLCSGTASKAITVNPLPVTAAISGPTTVCSGSTITLTDATTGGVWSSASPSVATIGTTGVVTPVSVGTTVITYANSNGTCTNYITATINSANTPAASSVTPSAATICFGGPSAQLTASGGAVAASATFNSTISPAFGPALTATSPINVTGIPAGATITGFTVNFNATQGSGAWDSDDLLNLQAPNSNIINLVDAKGGSSSTQGFVNTNISSASSTPIPATGAPYTGTYSADTIIGAGSPASTVTTWSSLYTTAASVNGTWDLIGNFLFTSGSTTINSWSITVFYTVPPAYTWAPTAGLFTNPGATTTYTGSSATSVYAEPATTTTVTLTSSNGACTSTAIAVVSVNPLPAITATANSTVCYGSSATLTAGGGVSYSWASSVGLSATTGSSVSATPASNTTYTVTGTASTGCMNTATAFVSVNPLPSPITGNLNVCASGGSTTLSDGTTPGTWSISNSNASIGASSGAVTGVTAGISVATYTIPTTCYVTANVTVDPLPVITGSGSTAICVGQSAPLSAGGGVAYSWMPSAGLSATTGAAVTATPTVTTTYTITGTGPAISATAISYVQAFTNGVAPTTQCTAWTAFRASLNSSTNYSGFRMKGTMNPTGITCTDPAVAAAVAAALHNGTPYVGSSDGQTWQVNIGGCTSPVCGSLYVELSNQGSCSCALGYCVRPTINNPNWGGIGGITCGAASQTMEVDFFVGTACNNSTTVTVTVNPLPTISTIVGSGTAICNGSSTAITATGAVNYTWSPSTGLDATTGTIVNADPTSNQSYLITGTDVNGCINTGNVAVTVNPLPAAITGTLNFCLGSTVTLGETSTGGTWTSSNTAVANVDPALGVVSGVTTGVDTITYTLPTTCSAFVSGTVNPLSDVTVSPLLGQTVCNGASTTPITFSGSVPGTVYNWVNTLPSIGIPASGSDTIFSVSAVDTFFVSDTGYFTVTPSNNGCPGTPGSFYIAVNPTPDVHASNPPQTLCNGAMTAPISFAGDVAGTIFTWTNTNSSIGIPASGGGNIASFAGVDTSAQPVTAVILVSTSAAGCTGTSNSFTITIDPTPLLIGSLTASICDSALFNYVPSSATMDSTFTWSRASVTGISEPSSSGTNNTNEYLDNTTLAPVAVTYVYIVQANGCYDTANVVVTVNPTPHLTSLLAPPAVCDSALFRYIPAGTIGGVAYTWSRAAVAGISNPAATGIDSIKEYLVNTTPNPLSVHYVDTLTSFGCQYTEVVVATVNPKPLLATPLSLPQVCDSTTITYVPNSLTTGTTFTWSRAAIGGNPAATGADTIHEELVNTGTASVVVVYVDTLKANGCWNAEDIRVRVMPTPVMSSSLTPPGICDSGIFNYTPMTATAGTGFTWSRAFVTGILNAPESNMGNPNEQLINTTNDNLNVTYVYTLNDSGCTHTQDVVVEVHPTPVLSSPLTATVCSGAPFVYGPTSYTAGTTFGWKRNLVSKLSPATDTGSGVSITETFVDSLQSPIATGYLITLTANGCSHKESIAVTVDPTPPAAQITTFAQGQMCAGTAFQNFGTSGLPATGETYTWSAQNCEIYAQGAGHQYILVTFNNPGAASVALTTDINKYGCRSYSAVNYNVGSSAAQMPQVIYFNGQFVCLQNNLVNYQWGYDDAITLDSALFAGEVNPNYFNGAPDLTYKYYWVATTDSGGCEQKTYYNMPTGISNVNAPVKGDVRVYPNPANDVLNVVFSNSISGRLETEVDNMLGQKLMAADANDHTAQLNVASLPAGTYIVVCYSNGIKIDAVRFVKN